MYLEERKDERITFAYAGSMSRSCLAAPLAMGERKEEKEIDKKYRPPLHKRRLSFVLSVQLDAFIRSGRANIDLVREVNSLGNRERERY